MSDEQGEKVYNRSTPTDDQVLKLTIKDFEKLL